MHCVNPWLETPQGPQRYSPRSIGRAHSPILSIITPPIIDWSSPSMLEQHRTKLDANSCRGEEKTHHIVCDMFRGGDQRIRKESARSEERKKLGNNRSLIKLGAMRSISNEMLDNILKRTGSDSVHDDVAVHSARFSYLPQSPTSVTFKSTPTTPVIISPPALPT